MALIIPNELYLSGVVLVILRTSVSHNLPSDMTCYNNVPLRVGKTDIRISSDGMYPSAHNACVTPLIPFNDARAARTHASPNET